MKIISESTRTAVMTHGGKDSASVAYETVKIDTKSQRLSEDEIQTLFIGADREGTHISEMEKISGQTTGLTMPMPPIPK